MIQFLEICEDPGSLKAIYFAKQILSVAFTLIPIGLIVMIMLDFFKNIAEKSDAMQKNLQKAIRRAIYCVLLFLVPTFINLTVALVNEIGIKVTYAVCWENATLKVIKEKEIEDAEKYLKILEENYTEQNYNDAETAINQVSDKEKREKYIERLKRAKEGSKNSGSGNNNNSGGGNGSNTR